MSALIAALPLERVVYLGDTARLPYGTKSHDTVAAYAVQAALLLAGFGVKCLVVACNTASSAGLPAIRARLPALPVLVSSSRVPRPSAPPRCRARSR